MYVKYVPFVDYADMELVDCYGFEQIVENNIKTKEILKLMGEIAEAKKSVKKNKWLSNDDFYIPSEIGKMAWNGRIEPKGNPEAVR